MKAVSTARRLVGVAARASGINPAELLQPTASSASDRTLLDERWYSAQHDLGNRSRAELVDHYRRHGAAEGLDPHPLFDTTYYLSQLDDGESCEDPTIHYRDEGVARGLDPHRLFDTTWYLETYPDVEAAGLNPLIHYFEHGGIEGRSTCEDFDGGWYLDEYPDVAAAGVNPLVHYVLHGKDEGRFPSLEAKQARLVTINAGVVNIGSTLPLDRTDWRGAARLLTPPVRPTIDIDAADLADYKIASFDVWDTLIMRRCHPEEIKLASARWLHLTANRWLRSDFRSIGALYRGRLAAEAKVSFGDDNEYRFNEAAAAWVRTALVDTVSERVMTETIEGLLAHELAAETRATYRNVAMDPVLAGLDGRTIVFASDFYLPSEFIQRLLLANGVNGHFGRTFVSCEDGRAKRSGAMFDRIVDELGADRADIVHIGDNRLADVDAASRAGIHAVHHTVTRSSELDRAVVERIEGDDAAYDPFIGAAIAEAEERAGLAEGDPDSVDDQLRRLGIRFAPVAVGLALRVVEEAVQNGVDTIYFFTREGVFLKQLVDQIIEADPYGVTYPETELLEISRVATFAASLDGFSVDELMKLWTVYSSQSPKGLVASLGLDPGQAEQVFARQGLAFDESVTHPWLNEQFLRAIQDDGLRAEAEELMTERRDLVRRYATQMGLDDGNPMIVDLGWRGTIQDNLSRATGIPLRGVYLGLYQFLNDQPSNSSKIGWLFDHNDDEDDGWTIDEVAPLEMLFNAVGGSVVAYEADGSDGPVTARRLVDDAEEAVIAQRVVPFHQGVMDALGGLLDLVALHAMTSEHLRPLARRLVLGLVRQPPSQIAEAFFDLSHNETFGTGSFDDLRSGPDLDVAAAELERSALYSALAEVGANCRWPEGMAVLSEAVLRRRPGPRALHVPTRVFASSPDVTTEGLVGVFAPSPIVGSGGHRTIYNLARGIAATGLDVQLFLDGFGTGIDDVVNQLRGSGVNIAASWDTSTRFDYAIATVAASSAHVEQVSAKARGYLVQDFEAYFNPVSDGYISAESSYTDAFDFLTVGSWLGHVLQTRYGSAAFSSGLGANHEVYRILDDEEHPGREDAVCFLYQPEKPRRTPQLGIEALELVKRARPDVKVYVYGSDAAIDLDFEVENLGLVRNLDDLNDLYNRCKVGLCISMTNPSRIPFELMAAGVVPVDVYRYNTLFDYDDGTALLAYQSPDSLAAGMLELLNSDEKLADHRQRCAEFIAERPLGWETEVMVNTVLARISGIDIEPEQSRPSFTLDPVIAKKDDTESTRAFCRWQRWSASS